MKYITTEVEVKTTQTGKTYKKALVSDGNRAVQVSVWPDYSQYDKVVEGGEVEGQISVKGKYSNLVDGNLSRPRNNIGQAMAKKAESIEHSQDRKDLSIRLSSTFRDATIITAELMKQDPKLNWKETWLKTRFWLVEKWEVIEHPKMVGGAEYPMPEEEGIDTSDNPF